MTYKKDINAILTKTVLGIIWSLGLGLVLWRLILGHPLQGPIIVKDRLPEIKIGQKKSCKSTGLDKFKKKRGVSFYNIYESIETYSQLYGVDPQTLFAMALVESSLYPSSRYPISHSGARGLLQLMPLTRKDLFKKMGFKKNNHSLDAHIQASIYYKKWINDMIPSWIETPYLSNEEIRIAAYNYGVSGILKRIKSKRLPPLTSHQYSNSVILYKKLQSPSQDIFKY